MGVNACTVDTLIILEASILETQMIVMKKISMLIQSKLYMYSDLASGFFNFFLFNVMENKCTYFSIAVGSSCVSYCFLMEISL